MLFLRRNMDILELSSCVVAGRLRLSVSECTRRLDHHRLWPLLRGRRKTACVDELDSSRCRPGFADLTADPHLSGKEDTPFGSTSNPIASSVSGRARQPSKVRFHESQQGLMRAVIALNFRLHIDVCCSIFTVPFRSSPLLRIFSYGRHDRIST